MKNYDAVIIGGGIVGTTLAWNLSKYKLSIALLEEKSDLAKSTSGANSGIIHAGYDAEENSLMAKLNVEGNRIYHQIHEQIKVSFKQTGSLVLAFDDNDMQTLNKLYKRGLANKVEGLRIIDKNELSSIEPNTKDSQAIAALYAPTAAVISPYEAVIAFAEIAMSNGAEVYLNHKVTEIQNGTITAYNSIDNVPTTFKAGLIFNCAGLSAGKINELAGAEQYKLQYKKGEYILYDKIYGNYTNTVVFQPPTKAGKGVLVTPTADGNLLIGPSSEPIVELETATTAEGLDTILAAAMKSCPTLPTKNSITTFAGIRAVSGNDFIIEESKRIENYYYALGICSPGLTAAPAIAKYITELVQNNHKLQKKEHVNQTRTVAPDFSELSWEERAALASRNPQYGKIICRCETVTEAEILHAISTASMYACALPSVDWVKRRCRAGLGRCQGSFCRIYISKLLERRHHINDK